MARQIRIEYEGALYHVMARGNRREAIFVSPDGEDEALFLETLEEACARSGFQVWAWVLMGNHYHLVLETPQANLVSGMGWLQNTYTRRFNARHRQWGRLFGDRYKSVLVEPNREGGGSSYLATLLDYVHLNPARSGWVQPEEPGRECLLDYPWSSLSQAYALPPRRRKPWMGRVADGLALFGFADTARGRRQLIKHLDERIAREEAEHCGREEREGQTLHSTLARGWYWGSQAFKERMLAEVEKQRAANGALPSSPSFASSQQAGDFHESAAESLIKKGVEELGLSGGKSEDFEALERGDWRGVAVAWAICRNTTVSQTWIAERLGMKSRANVSQRVRQFTQLEDGALSSGLRKWRRQNKI